MKSTPAPPVTATARRPPRVPWRLIAPTLLLLPSLLWVILDRSVWQWDQAWYGKASVELNCALRQHPASWMGAMRNACGGKAPGIAWFGQFFVPLGQVLGSIDLALHLSIVACQWLTLVLIYRIGRRMVAEDGSAIPLAGCMLVGAAPLFVGLSHQYFVEPLQTLAVTWMVYTAVVAPTWTRLQMVTHVLAAGSVAMLAKLATPAYCLLPGLMAAAALLGRKPAREEARPTRAFARWLCLLGSLLLFAATAAWYHRNLASALRFAYRASVGEAATHYGQQGDFLTKFSYWISALRVGLFTSVSIWCVILVGATGILVAFSRRLRGCATLVSWRITLVAILCLVHVFVFLAMAARATNEETRYLMPLLPLLAVPFMRALMEIGDRGVSVACVVLFVAQLVHVQGIAFGLVDPNGCKWLRRFDTDAGKAREVARVVALTSGEESTANCPNVVGVDLPWFNLDACNYCAAKNTLSQGWRPYYTNLGYFESDEQKAFQRLDDLHPGYFITLDGSIPHNSVNQVAESVARRVAADRRYQRQPYVSDYGVVIYRRTLSPSR